MDYAKSSMPNLTFSFFFKVDVDIALGGVKKKEKINLKKVDIVLSGIISSVCIFISLNRG